MKPIVSFILFSIVWLFSQTVQSSPSKPQLIVVSFPCQEHKEYYYKILTDEGYTFDTITDFHVAYAKAAQSAGDEFMIVTTEGCIEFKTNRFTGTGAKILTLPKDSGLDLWMRDFLTIGKENPIHFNYEPWYLEKDTLSTESFESFMKYIGAYESSILASNLDNANAVDTESKMILTQRVLMENDTPALFHSIHYFSGTQPLSIHDMFTCPLSKSTEDTTGHHDGDVSFIDSTDIILADDGMHSSKTSDEFLANYFNQNACVKLDDNPSLTVE